MNVKTKRLMDKQVKSIKNNLTTHFNLPVFQDNVAEDELKELSSHNYFIVVYGDIQSTGVNNVYQEVSIVFISENNDLVDEDTIDIITLISNISAIEFDRTFKQSGQKKDTDDFIDQVTTIFKRKITYDCTI
ncbi:hypothetical protein [Bacillus suaedae]|uniref:Uncharacterized protein n=1 Tax=Halalkalibacter suaedae TaxID=2822140 RepID=A0A940WST8_9BACI|nr:hypothetical protein [Bacillus suaedae]MBP3951128.1 hypothetical protein [Bacillus suaedae]